MLFRSDALDVAALSGGVYPSLSLIGAGSASGIAAGGMTGTNTCARAAPLPKPTARPGANASAMHTARREGRGKRLI